MPKAKRKPQLFRLRVRGVRVTSWLLPVNRDSGVAWKDRTEGDDERRRAWPEMRARAR